MMDVASFIGFPGITKNKSPDKTQHEWWDKNGNLPIARTVNIASYSKKREPFENPLISTTDVVLVSGLSFSGSSGSPILLHQKGILINHGDENIKMTDSGYVPPKIIGIMSGHWQEQDMLQHSGLSYFTKSTAIHDLIHAL